MVLVRIAYAADLPAPEDVIRDLQNGAAPSAPGPANGGSGGRPPRMDAPRGAPRASLAPAQLMTAQVPDIATMRAAPAATAPAAATGLSVASFPALIALAAEKRDILMKTALERDVRLVRFEDGKLEIALEKTARNTIVQDLQRKISEWTGKRWMVVVSSAAEAAPTVQQQQAVQQTQLEEGVRADPLVKAVLARFPGAEIVSVRRRDEAPELPGMPQSDDEPLPNPDDYGASDMDED
jgi:DNA polymerase-3 subunit gamma/tau